MNRFNLVLSVLTGFVLISCSTPKISRQPSGAKGSELVIQVEDQERRFTREQLLAMPQAKQVTVVKDPAYKDQSRTYTAVPFSLLFKDLPMNPNGTLVFSCLDGFSAPIDIRRVLNQDPKNSIAYIAIEPAGQAWPPLKATSPASAGPFYLIWDNPEKSNIKTEEWPFQLSGFTWRPSIEMLYPLTVPDPKLALSAPAQRGYRVFLQNCFACHRMNGQGTSEVGPDLNLPYNPTEYLKPGFFMNLVRNPQNLRHWPQAKMPPFDPAAISHQDMLNLEAYLRHMSGRKKKTGT